MGEEFLRAEMAVLVPLLQDLLRKADQASRIRSKFRERKLKLWVSTSQSWTSFVRLRRGVSGEGLPEELVILLKEFAPQYREMRAREVYFASLLHKGMTNVRTALDAVRQQVARQDAGSPVQPLFATVEQVVERVDAELTQYYYRFQEEADLLRVIERREPAVRTHIPMGNPEGSWVEHIDEYDAFRKLEELLREEIAREKFLCSAFEAERAGLERVKASIERELSKEKSFLKFEKIMKGATKWGGFASLPFLPANAPLVLLWLVTWGVHWITCVYLEGKLSREYVKRLEQAVVRA